MALMFRSSIADETTAFVESRNSDLRARLSCAQISLKCVQSPINPYVAVDLFRVGPQFVARELFFATGEISGLERRASR